ATGQYIRTFPANYIVSTFAADYRLASSATNQNRTGIYGSTIHCAGVGDVYKKILLYFVTPAVSKGLPLRNLECKGFSVCAVPIGVLYDEKSACTSRQLYEGIGKLAMSVAPHLTIVSLPRLVDFQ